MCKEAIKQFFGEKKTLAQSIADGAIKAVFSGLVVAAAALLVLGEVEESLERSRKRAALQTLQNTTLSQALEQVGNAYVALDCARQGFQLLEAECKNELDAMIALLRARQGLLVALIPDRDFSSIVLVIEIAKRMRDLRSQDELNEQGKKLRDEFSEAFNEMVDAVANNFG